jgi:chromate reductase, NAD(P)H dehydrogenase (quinone)
MSDTSVSILGVVGSLRAQSWNRKLLAAVAHLLPPGATLSTFDLAPIPLYNEDVREQGYPDAVAAFRAAIAGADAVLFVTPEYNYSVPGVLKNAIDWASRPPTPPLAKKPVATLGGSPGNHGTVRAQSHLKEVCMGLGMYVIPKPEVYVAKVNEKFDAEGNLTDEATKKFVGELLANLTDFARTMRGR